MELAVVAALHILRHMLGLEGHNLVEEDTQAVAELVGMIAGGSH